MSAAPRLHPSVSITRRQIGEDEVFYIVKDPRSGTFLRMGEVEVAVLRLLDGRRTWDEVAEALGAAHGYEVTAGVIREFVETLTDKGIVESRRFDPEAFRREWAIQERARRRSLGSLFGSIATIKVKLFNPRRLFDAIVDPLGFLWTRTFFVWSMAFLILGAIMGLLHREEILRDTTASFRAMTASAGTFASHAAVFYIVFFIVVAIHETAHGLTCTRYGGKVSDMGFILFYLQIPGFYCDVTDAYGFEKRSHRLWTTVAGGYTGLILATFGVLIWWATEPGGLVNDAGIALMVVGGPPLLIINWNPLIRYDGYYILMDFLEAPNLMSNSYKYLGYLLKRHVLRVPVDPDDLPAPRLRKVYVVYGICSFLFLAPIIAIIPIIIFYIFSGIVGPEVATIAAVMLGYRILKPRAVKIHETLRYAWLTHRPAVLKSLQGASGRVRGGALAMGALLAGGLLLFGPRIAVRAEGIVVLEPWTRIEVAAGADGFVPVDPRRIAAYEGDRVDAGQRLVDLANPTLEADHAVTRLEAERLRLDLAALVARGDPSTASVRRAGLRALESREETLADQIARLDVRAPIDGVVLTPRLDLMAGRYLRQGETWCVVGETGRLRARVRLTQTDLGSIRADSEAELKTVHLPGRTFPGRVARLPAGRPPDTAPFVRTAAILPAEDQDGPEVRGSLDVVVVFDNSEGLLLPGMQAAVRIYGDRLTPAGHAARWLHRLFKGKVWW